MTKGVPCWWRSARSRASVRRWRRAVATPNSTTREFEMKSAPPTKSPTWTRFCATSVAYWAARVSASLCCWAGVRVLHAATSEAIAFGLRESRECAEFKILTADRPKDRH